MSNRSIRTEVTTDGETTQVAIYIDGWRLDLTVAEAGSPHTMLNVANVALEGPEAGWCACIYDSENVENRAITLDGSEEA